MNKVKTKRKIAAIAAVVLAGTMAFPFVSNGLSASATSNGLSPDGKYYTDYETLDDAKEAAAVVAENIASEGSTLLKNSNNALPMRGSEKISVFGTGSDYMAGKTGDLLCPALESEGFHVNPQLHDFYSATGTTYGTEVTEFNKNIENSFELYNDAAVIVLSRGGGEGADMPTMTGEKTDGKFADGTAHADLGTDAAGNQYKHFLQLTDSEQELLDYVKSQGFKKIVYLINCSEIFEIYDLVQDDAVDSILWIGRPGEVGNNGVAKILSGKVNPSGKTVDTWYKDFTADPTWKNFGDNSQNGSTNRYSDKDGNNTSYYGIDYEEDIYIGYRYYETRAFDENDDGQWYSENVVYPFGYGLSYTSYEYSGLSVKLDDGSALNGTIDGGKLASSAGKEAEIKSGTATITVTNTGDVAGKETVELYAHAPYTEGETEKSHVVLVGFAKTDIIEPGDSQTIEINFNFQDMASYDYSDANKNGNKGYELDYGNYTLYALANAHGWADENAQKIDFAIDAPSTATGTDAIAANLKLDDYSGNEVSNLFSKENGIFYSLRDNSGKYQINLSEAAVEKLMNRAAGFEESFPETPTKADMTLSDGMIASLEYFDNFKVDTTAEYADGKNHYTGAADGYATDTTGEYTTSDYPWMEEYEANKDRMSDNGWTQAASHEADYSDVDYQLALMAGIDPYGTVPLTKNDTTIEEFVGKTGAEAWDIFMNQLTYQELVDICGRLQKSTLASIGKGAISGQDSSWNYASTFCFTCGCINTATWNVDLAEQEGRIIGNLALLSGNDTWWGNSVQTHRSPFGGRAFEYTSEDGLLGGYMAGSKTLGATKMGVACYVKHVALNDQETNRNGKNLFAWVSEQAAREIYFKSSEIVVQYGQAAGVMGAFARVGRMSVNTNYQFVTELFRNEWGSETISFTTDMYAGMSSCSPLDLIVRAGTDTVATTSGSGTWDATADSGLEGTTGAVVIGESKTVSNIQWYTYRTRAMIHLWTCANTAIGDNGVDLAKITDKTVNVVRGATTSISAVPEMTYADGSAVNKEAFTVTAGTAPAGLTFNSDGTLTGTPTEEGTYTLTVKAVADGYASKSVKITVNVVSPITATEEDGKIKLELSDSIVLGQKPTTSDPVGTAALTAAEITGVEGLPEGMTYDEATNTISGSYSGEEVTYTVNVQFTTSTVSSGWTGTSVSDRRTTVPVEFKVGTPAQTVENPDFQVKVEDGWIMVSNDAGETWTNVIEVADLKGADGADGADGTNGTDGTTPTIEINEDGYWVINGVATDVKAEAKGGGCNGSVEGTALAVAGALAAIGAFVVLRKKIGKKN
mgnify:CR=1 FL=1